MRAVAVFGVTRRTGRVSLAALIWDAKWRNCV
jgi:hypothetical protein